MNPVIPLIISLIQLALLGVVVMVFVRALIRRAKKSAMGIPVRKYSLVTVKAFASMESLISGPDSVKQRRQIADKLRSLGATRVSIWPDEDKLYVKCGFVSVDAWTEAQTQLRSIWGVTLHTLV